MFHINQAVYIRLRSFLVLFSNLFALCLLSLFSFNRNTGRLLTGLDGPALASASDVQFSFFGITPHMHSNILEGLGNTYTNNLTLMPSFFNYYLGSYSPAPLFTWFALQLFICVLLAGWNYGFNSRISYAAAWLLTIIFLPYFNDFRIYSVTEAAPLFIELVLVFVIMDIGICRMGSINWLNTFIYGAILFLGLIMGLILCPTSLMLIAPVLLLTMIHAFVKTKNRAELLCKLVIGLTIVFIALAAGWVHFLYGLIADSVAKVFYSDISGMYHSLIYVSILFLGQIPASTWGPWFFYSSTLGILLAIFKSPRLRSLGITILLAQILIVGGGSILMSMSRPWLGPSPIYCEVILFPFYALFTIYLFAQIINIIPWIHLSNKWFDVISPFAIATIIILSIIIYPPSIDRGKSYTLPPSSTAITEILEKEIALNPNAIFSGRVANILPKMDWLQQCSFFLAVNGATGNDHQSSGLWLKHIPTLHEYNQITPGFFCIYRRFLSDASETIYRNWTNFSQINLKILKLIGVRFIISTLPEIKETKLRAQLKIKNDIFPFLYLHELTDVNIAGISAKLVINAKNIHEAENLMDTNNFDLHNAIVISNIQYNHINFLPATKSRLSIEHGGFRLKAESKGKTLLILPIEFSHCLHVTVLSGINPKIMRVDAALTGIVFDRQVDILLDNRTGPFANPRCKMKDYREFTKLWQTA